MQMRRAFGRNLLVFASERQAFDHALTLPQIHDFVAFGSVTVGHNALDFGPLRRNDPMPLGKGFAYVERS